MTVTRDIKGMYNQNLEFEKLEPNHFKRVHVMAADIKQTIKEDSDKETAKRNKKYELYERNMLWKKR